MGTITVNIQEAGKKFEYKLLYWLHGHGFKAARIPASGSGKQPLPDIIAVRNGLLYAFEVKSTKYEILKIDEYQIKKLFDFCDMFSSIVPQERCLKYVAVYWKYDRISPCFYIVPMLQKYTIERWKYECEKI